MGIDLHTFRFISGLARQRPLGRVLTIGRQGVDFEPTLAGSPPVDPTQAAYCEWALQALGAQVAESIDYSDYEGPTHVADLGQPTSLSSRYDMVIDAGSLEHVFDVATAFRNLIGFTADNGRIVHVLPVNNLSGHGFWQFSSDLIYALYSAPNGFADTRVYYASSLNPDLWHLVPEPQPGTRTELVSIEPVTLLSVTTKRHDVATLAVTQPFYAKAWDQHDAAQIASEPSPARKAFAKMRRFGLYRLLRNVWTVAGLLAGTSRYAMGSARFIKRKSQGGEGANP